KASINPATRSADIALRCSGRSRVTCATPPVVMTLIIIDCPVYFWGFPYYGHMARSDRAVKGRFFEMGDLKGQVWLITGASAGFGRALSDEILSRGGSVVATARNIDTVRDIVAKAPDR